MQKQIRGKQSIQCVRDRERTKRPEWSWIAHHICVQFSPPMKFFLSISYICFDALDAFMHWCRVDAVTAFALSVNSICILHTKYVFISSCAFDDHSVPWGYFPLLFACLLFMSVLIDSSSSYLFSRCSIIYSQTENHSLKSHCSDELHTSLTLTTNDCRIHGYMFDIFDSAAAAAVATVLLTYRKQKARVFIQLART